MKVNNTPDDLLTLRCTPVEELHTDSAVVLCLTVIDDTHLNTINPFRGGGAVWDFKEKMFMNELMTESITLYKNLLLSSHEPC